MAASVNSFGQAIITAMAAPSSPTSQVAPGPIRLSNAIKTAIRLEKAWLSARDLGAFVDLLRQDISNVDTYLAMEDVEDVRQEWVRTRLDQIDLSVL